MDKGVFKEPRTTPTLSITVRLKYDFNKVVEEVKTRLKAKGFVVVTEIDIKETLKQKLNIVSPPFKVYRVYSPPLVSKANLIAPDSSLLPYNITIAQMEDGSVEISIVDPLPVVTVVNIPELGPIVTEAHSLLQHVIEELKQSTLH